MKRFIHPKDLMPPRSYADPAAVDRALVNATTVEEVTQLTRLKNRSLSYGQGAGTHLPLLISVVATAPPGDVLECGAGHFSSPMLSMLCNAVGRKLISLERPGSWYDTLDDLIGAHHIRVEMNGDIWVETASITIYMAPVAVVFVDHGLYDADRLAMVTFLENRVPLIVVHDTRNPWLTQTDKALNGFKYRFDYTLMSPVTTVVSNTIDVTEKYDPFHFTFKGT